MTRLLDINGVAKHFHVHRTTVERWIENRLLVPSHDLNRNGRRRRYRFNSTAIAACQAQFVNQDRPAGWNGNKTIQRRVSAGRGDDT